MAGTPLRIEPDATDRIRRAEPVTAVWIRAGPASIASTTFASSACPGQPTVSAPVAAVADLAAAILTSISGILILLCCASDQCTSERARTVKII